MNARNGKPDRIDQAILDAVDPLKPTHAEFDWHSLYLSLGEVGDWDDDDLNTKTAQALRRIFEWVLDVPMSAQSAGQLHPTTAIGRRFVALAWVIRPDYFEGAPSAKKLAHELGLNTALVCTLTAAAARHFSTANMGQATRPEYKGHRHPGAHSPSTPPPRPSCPRTCEKHAEQANTPEATTNEPGGTQAQPEAQP